MKFTVSFQIPNNKLSQIRATKKGRLELYILESKWHVEQRRTPKGTKFFAARFVQTEYEVAADRLAVEEILGTVCYVA